MVSPCMIITLELFTHGMPFSAKMFPSPPFPPPAKRGQGHPPGRGQGGMLGRGHGCPPGKSTITTLQSPDRASKAKVPQAKDDLKLSECKFFLA